MTSVYELSDGNYELSLFMKIQFFFRDAAGQTWTAAERSAYMQNWKRAVSTAWNVRRLHTTKTGRQVSLTVSFETQEGGFMFDHWEIEVTKVASGGRRTTTYEWQPISTNNALPATQVCGSSRDSSKRTHLGERGVLRHGQLPVPFAPTAGKLAPFGTTKAG
ncbi:MAG TPA: hypothetical protein VJV78_28710 [Polyangiales bacterium]|nr:hypothetical protein [Polyangiales bacterium]